MLMPPTPAQLPLLCWQWSLADRKFGQGTEAAPFGRGVDQEGGVEFPCQEACSHQHEDRHAGAQDRYARGGVLQYPHRARKSL